MALKIISYNVNGIRAAVKKGFLDWMEAGQYDIVCLQETKAMEAQAPVEMIEALGYQHYWHSAEKKGYSGVAIFSKVAPDQVVVGCGIEKYDREGRVIRADYGDWTILNCYFPSGSSGDLRHEFKMEFLADFFDWVKVLRKARPNLIVVGDYNIVHTELDIHNPARKDNPSGYRPEERAWMTDWLASGFTDAFRFVHPEEKAYSWWSYRAGSRGKDKGWRIDYQSVANSLQAKIKNAQQLKDAVHSDHCPVLLEIDL